MQTFWPYHNSWAIMACAKLFDWIIRMIRIKIEMEWIFKNLDSRFKFEVLNL